MVSEVEKTEYYLQQVRIASRKGDWQRYDWLQSCLNIHAATDEVDYSVNEIQTVNIKPEPKPK